MKFKGIFQCIFSFTWNLLPLNNFLLLCQSLLLANLFVDHCLIPLSLFLDSYIISAKCCCAFPATSFSPHITSVLQSVDIAQAGLISAGQGRAGRGRSLVILCASIRRTVLECVLKSFEDELCCSAHVFSFNCYVFLSKGSCENNISFPCLIPSGFPTAGQWTAKQPSRTEKLHQVKEE